MRLTIDGLRHDDSCEPSRKPPVIVRRAQRSIDSRRRNLEGVAMVDRVFDVQHCAHVPADMLQIPDCGRGIRATASLGFVEPRRVDVERHVNKDSQHPADRLAPELNIENLQIVGAGHPLGNGANSLNELRKTTLKNKKWATGPLSGLAGSYEPESLSQGGTPNRTRGPTIRPKTRGPQRLEIGSVKPTGHSGSDRQAVPAIRARARGRGSPPSRPWAPTGALRTGEMRFCSAITALRRFFSLPRTSSRKVSRGAVFVE